MLMYAVAVYPLISRLKDPDRHRQNWFADDSACASLLLWIKDWFLHLINLGPAYGHFTEQLKSILVVKEPYLEDAKNLFADLQVEIVLSSRFLGGCIGTADGIRQDVASQVDMWAGYLEQLAEAARAYPQSAYSAFTRSLACEWSFLQRVVEGCDDEYGHLQNTIRRVFTPSVFGREVLEREHDLLELPVKLGGLALSDQVKSA